MPNDYEEYYSLFYDYIEKQIQSMQDKLKNVDQNSKLRKIYKDLESRNYLKFVEYYGVLSKVSSSLKDNLDVIDFLVKNNITSAPQMEEAIDKVLSDKTLLRLISNHESKEFLEGMLQKLISIKDGTCDFETLKNALLDSNLSEECIIGILTHEAEKSTEVEHKKLPSLDENNQENNEIISNCRSIIKKINKLTHDYYHVVKSKPNNIIDMYRKTISLTAMDKINDIYQEKDVLVCMHVLHLIDLKNEALDLLDAKPIDYSLIELCIEELTYSYEEAMKAIAEYEKQNIESMPQEASLYFLTESGETLFNIDGFNEEEKKNIVSILKDLEAGLFDYERNKGNHTIVRQSIRKDINVFVNRKRNMTVSYIRINSEELNESKVLVLSIADIRKIFDLSQSILRNNGKDIDENVSKIKENDSEYISKEEELRDEILSKLSVKEVTLHE